MPYIITTTTPYVPDRDRGDSPAHAWEPVTTRSAVATLDEAREVVAAAYAEHGRGAPRPGWNDPLGSCEVPRHFGPLPDGTTIAVAPVEWDVLRDALTVQQRDRGLSGPETIAAYNAAQEES